MAFVFLGTTTDALKISTQKATMKITFHVDFVVAISHDMVELRKGQFWRREDYKSLVKHDVIDFSTGIIS